MNSIEKKWNFWTKWLFGFNVTWNYCDSKLYINKMVKIYGKLSFYDILNCRELYINTNLSLQDFINYKKIIEK